MGPHVIQHCEGNHSFLLLSLCSSSCIPTCNSGYYDSDLVNVIEEGRLVSVRVYLFNPIDPITLLDSNYTGPINTNGYVSNNVTFSASVPSTCHLRLYFTTFAVVQT